MSSPSLPGPRARLSLLVLSLFALFSSCASAAERGTALVAMRGADVSFLPQLESLGVTFKEGGAAKPLLAILKDNGINWIRLRLWVDPSARGGWCGLSQTVALAKRVKAAGFSFLLDIHYSDWWADPGQQNVPAAWAGLSFADLAARVSSYTEDSLEAFVDAGAAPDMVQVGNEITNGMLWPMGKVGYAYNFSSPALYGNWDSTWRTGIPLSLVGDHLWQATLPAGDLSYQVVSGSSWYGDSGADGKLESGAGPSGNISLPASASGRVIQVNDSSLAYSYAEASAALPLPWDRLASLLDAGLSAVRSAVPGAKTMLHIDRGADEASCRSWFDAAAARGLSWDVIGLSYYPFWQGTDLDVLSANLNNLASRYGKEVCIVETSYPWSLGYADSEANTVGTAGQLVPGYPASPAGQKAYLARLASIVASVPGGKGLGVFWWEPDFVAAPGFPSSQENLAWFDFGYSFNGSSRALIGE